MFQFWPSGWTGGLHHLPPVVLWSNALMGFPVGTFCTWGHSLLRVAKGLMSLSSMMAQGPLMHIQRPAPPCSCNCSCRGVEVGCHLLLWLSLSIFNSSIQAASNTCQWASLASWRLYHVGSLSPGTGSGILFGSWATEWPWEPPLALLQHGSTPLSSWMAPQGRQAVFDGLFHLVRSAGQ